MSQAVWVGLLWGTAEIKGMEGGMGLSATHGKSETSFFLDSKVGKFHQCVKHLQYPSRFRLLLPCKVY